MRYLRALRDDPVSAAILALGLAMLALMLLPACSQAQVPPEIESLTEEEWTVEAPDMVTGETDSGDWFILVFGEYLGAQVNDTTYAKCEEIGAPFFSTQDLAATADSVLSGQATYDGQSLWVARTECITTFRALADSLQTD